MGFDKAGKNGFSFALIVCTSICYIDFLNSITQGVLSAWTLTETKGQCNEVFDSDAEHDVEDLFFVNRNQPNSSDTDVVHVNINNDTTESTEVVTSSNNNNWYNTDIPSKEDSKTTETASIDPDAEWITTKFTHVCILPESKNRLSVY